MHFAEGPLPIPSAFPSMPELPTLLEPDQWFHFTGIFSFPVCFGMTPLGSTAVMAQLILVKMIMIVISLIDQ